MELNVSRPHQLNVHKTPDMSKHISTSLGGTASERGLDPVCNYWLRHEPNQIKLGSPEPTACTVGTPSRGPRVSI